MFGALKFTAGGLKLGWFKKLKNSARKSTYLPPPSWNFLPERHIQVAVLRRAHDPDAGVAEAALRGHGERRLVEPAIDRLVGGLAVANPVGSGDPAGTLQRDVSCGHGNRKSCVPVDDAADIPSTEYRVDEAVPTRAGVAVPKERQLEHRGGSELCRASKNAGP